MLPYERLAQLAQPTPEAVWIEACRANAERDEKTLTASQIAARTGIGYALVKKHLQRHPEDFLATVSEREPKSKRTTLTHDFLDTVGLRIALPAELYRIRADRTKGTTEPTLGGQRSPHRPAKRGTTRPTVRELRSLDQR
jgi:hypothetical protein